MFTLLAQTPKPWGGFFEGLGPLGDVAGKGLALNIKNALKLFNTIISNIVGVMTIIAGIWFIFQFITGGIGWLSAGGDKAKLQAAQAKITQGIVGLIVVVIAFFLIDVVGALLGLDILSPGEVIEKLWGPLEIGPANTTLNTTQIP